METNMNDLQLFLANLRFVAKSPYSLLGYLGLIIAWALIAFRVRRHKELLRNIEKLPEKDRLKALRDEMGTVLSARGLDAAQYLTYVQRRYCFVGFCLIAFLVASLLVTSWYIKTLPDSGSVSIDVTPVSGSGTHQ
jgi:hypothetical protein